MSNSKSWNDTICYDRSREARVLQSQKDEIIKTLNEIYTLFRVEYIPTRVLLIDSPIRMWN
jgi:hypothetical protein